MCISWVIACMHAVYFFRLFQISTLLTIVRVLCVKTTERAWISTTLTHVNVAMSTPESTANHVSYNILKTFFNMTAVLLVPYR